jgi:phosphopantothenoylcysteine synthetase/decarboxylase
VSDKELDTRAREKIKTGICDLVVANDEQKKGVAFGTDTNEVLIVAGKSFAKHVLLAPKREIARQIVDVIVEQMK